MFFSQMARYSSVIGGCCPRTGGLVVSHWPPPPMRTHCPFQLGYFDSSNACAPETARHSAAASAKEPRSDLRVVVLPAGDPFGDVFLPDGAIFLGDRRLLPAHRRLGRIPLAAAADAHPLPLPVGIFRFVERLRAGDSEAQRGGKRKGAEIGPAGCSTARRRSLRRCFSPRWRDIPR